MQIGYLIILAFFFSDIVKLLANKAYEQIHIKGLDLHFKFYFSIMCVSMILYHVYEGTYASQYRVLDPLEVLTYDLADVDTRNWTLIPQKSNTQSYQVSHISRLKTH